MYVLLDIDTQHDFVDSDGALSVPGAEALKELYSRIYAFARQTGIPVIATMDCHIENDPEFEEYGFPAHCVRGTKGWEKIEETRCDDKLIVGMSGGAVTRLPGQLIIEKIAFSVFTNGYAEKVLLSDIPRLLGTASSDLRFVVFGVATDYCVKAAALGLRERGADVTVLEDAIAAVSEETGAAALKEMRDAGIGFVNFDDFVVEAG